MTTVTVVVAVQTVQLEVPMLQLEIPLLQLTRHLQLLLTRVLRHTKIIMPLPSVANAEDRDVIDARVNLALGQMWSKLPDTRKLSPRAKAMLVMPSVLKGGFIVGGV